MNAVDTTAVEVGSLNDINASRLAKYLQGDEWSAEQSVTDKMRACDIVYFSNSNAPLTGEFDLASIAGFLGSRCNQGAFPLWGAKPRVQTLVTKTLLNLYRSPLEAIRTERIETEPFVRAVQVRLTGQRFVKNKSNFLERATRLEKSGNVDDALDLLYAQIDGRLKAKQLDEIDALLQTINVASLSLDLLLGVLTASLPARYQLQSRKDFFNDVEAVLKERGQWEENLLSGLES